MLQAITLRLIVKLPLKLLRQFLYQTIYVLLLQTLKERTLILLLLILGF